jgi:hypothetical protein
MYMKPVAVAEPVLRIPGALKVALVYASVAVIWAGIGTVSFTGLLPGAGPLIANAKASVQSLLSPANTPAAMR